MTEILYSDDFMTIKVNKNQIVEVGNFPNTVKLKDFGFICDSLGGWNILSIQMAEYIANKLNNFRVFHDTLGNNLLKVLKY